MSPAYHGSRRGQHAPDGAAQHRDWLSLIEVTGPFLSLPVLRQTWPTLDALEKKQRERLRIEHATWLDDPAKRQREWLRYVLADLLGWGGELRETGLDALRVEVPEHDTDIVPSFALVEPGTVEEGGDVKPDAVRLLGMVCPPGAAPTGRVAGDAWAAAPVDRLAHLCRRHRVELGLATDGRWWALVWAPREKATTTAVFDAVSWPEAAERIVLRAFVSLLRRERFFGVPEGERLPALLRASLDRAEEITEALGVQVRQAVELLVAAIGRADVRARELGGAGLSDVDAHEVYRGAVAVMMRLVFLLFAEERGLLPADNDLYARAYSAGGLRAELQDRVNEGSEEELEHTSIGWHRLLALFTAVHKGIEHPRLTLHAHDGSLFNPGAYPWLPLNIDDRTVLHMLRAVQQVQIGTGRSRELRTLSFGTLDVEQIGYVYEGLLSFDGFRSPGVTLGLIGKQGLEEEVPLDELEAVVAGHFDVDGVAAALAEAYKESGIGSPSALAKRLVALDGVEREEQRKRLLAVTGGDYALAEKLLPYAGIIRPDLRGLPMVILPGALYVTESKLRKNSGTHYTPRNLAEEVVEGALEPLVYEPGPLQTADRTQWRLRSSEQILALKVADIAMGSAAFLVAAARYLGERLIEAWSAEGSAEARAYKSTKDDWVVGADEDPLVVRARRQIIEHCLYGVDINAMAVEMAKLSLWLVSMDTELPFTFLDDRLVTGDSLLGIGNLATLPEESRRDKRLDRDLAEVLELRRQIADLPDTLDGLAAKRRLLDEAHEVGKRAKAYADLVTGAALASVKANKKDVDYIARRVGALAVELAKGVEESDANEQARAWLATDQVPGSFDREPLHWPLEFPEVFEHGGFDAIIGNPPFLGGQKLTGALGTTYREHLIHSLGRGARGSADLVAYFALRANDLLNATGQTGLIATNTLAQGDTREVGLDQIVSGGATIRRAVKSEKWPSKSAVLEFCAIWTSHATLAEAAERVADGLVVVGITPSLDPESRVTGNPERLARNAGMPFQGSTILGMGFTMEPSDAESLIEKDSRNADVLFPYLNGQDLNSRPDCSASRWAINFHDWSEHKAETYTDCYGQVRRLVKPERDGNNRKVYRDYWWHYAEKRPAMLRAIEGLRRAVVITLVSRTAMPVMVPTGQVFSHALGVFATDDTAMLALLSSAPHYWWARSRASSMKTDLRYTPSDVFETLALPELTHPMRELGERLDTYRRESVMLARQAGLTATYNLVNDPHCHDEDIEELRRIHVAIDEAVCRAYHWDDLIAHGLDHGFHAAGRETRYTVGPVVQREFVDRLLELNHERYAAEVAAGLHTKKKSGGGKTAGQPSLF